MFILKITNFLLQKITVLLLRIAKADAHVFRCGLTYVYYTERNTPHLQIWNMIQSYTLSMDEYNIENNHYIVVSWGLRQVEE